MSLTKDDPLLIEVAAYYNLEDLDKLNLEMNNPKIVLSAQVWHLLIAKDKLVAEDLWTSRGLDGAYIMQLRIKLTDHFPTVFAENESARLLVLRGPDRGQRADTEPGLDCSDDQRTSDRATRPQKVVGAGEAHRGGSPTVSRLAEEVWHQPLRPRPGPHGLPRLLSPEPAAAEGGSRRVRGSDVREAPHRIC